MSEIPQYTKVRFIDLLRIFHLGFCYISWPVRFEDWPDDNPEDSFRRYATRSISIRIDKPSKWEPKRPCYYKWKYDGKKQYTFAGFGLCIRIGAWSEDVQLLKDRKIK